MKPAAVGQEFAANEYVSACTVTLDCSVTSSELFANYRLAVPSNAPSYFVNGEYWACGEVTVPVSELTACTFTHIADGTSTKPDTKLKNPIDAYFWVGTKANGDPDLHAFPSTAELAAAIESGKS